MDKDRESEIILDLSEAQGEPELLSLLDRPRWYWPEAVAWICLRDLNPMCELAFMRRHYEKSQDGFEKVVGSALLTRLKILMAERITSTDLPRNLDDAYEALVIELEKEGQIKSTGRRTPTGERVPIPGERWSGAKIIDRHRRTIDIGSAFHSEDFPMIWFYDIMVDRAELQAAFPDGKSAPQLQLVKPVTAIESPPPGRGRKRGTGIDDAKFLGLMKALVIEGLSVWDAAEKIAIQRKSLGIKGSTDEGVRKRLHTKYKQYYPDLT